MVEYLVVAFPHPSGGWVAVLPDFVGVTGRAMDIRHAIDRAAAAARGVCAIMLQIDRAMPRPCDLATAQTNHRWAAEYGIDWSTAVIESVWLSHPNSTPRRGRPKRRATKVAEWSKRTATRTDPDAVSVPQSDQ